VNDLAIRVRGLRKSYADREVLAGIDLEIHSGEIFAILGPNGAGKTTTIEILEGFRERDGGDVSVLGVDPAEGGAEWRSRIGIVLQTTGGLDELTVEECVTHFGRLYPNPLPTGQVISLVGLEAQRKTRTTKLSGGQLRRLDVALGLVGNPELIFLDEPTTGFDPSARRQAWEVVEGLRELGRTVVLTTHYLDEAEHLSDRVAVIAAGSVIEIATPDTLGNRHRSGARVSFRRDDALAGLALPTLWSDAVPNQVGHVEMVTDHPGQAVAELVAWCAAGGVDEPPELVVARPSLEEIYLTMIGEVGAHDLGAHDLGANS